MVEQQQEQKLPRVAADAIVIRKVKVAYGDGGGSGDSGGDS